MFLIITIIMHIKYNIIFNTISWILYLQNSVPRTDRVAHGLFDNTYNVVVTIFPLKAIEKSDRSGMCVPAHSSPPLPVQYKFPPQPSPSVHCHTRTTVKGEIHTHTYTHALTHADACAIFLISVLTKHYNNIIYNM